MANFQALLRSVSVVAAILFVASCNSEETAAPATNANPPFELGESVPTGANAPPTLHFVDEFYPGEAWGRWTGGNKVATFQFELASAADDVTGQLLGPTFGAAPERPVTVIVRIDDREVLNQVVDGEAEQLSCFSAGRLVAGGHTVAIETRNAQNPRDLGLDPNNEAAIGFGLVGFGLYSPGTAPAQCSG